MIHQKNKFLIIPDLSPYAPKWLFQKCSLVPPHPFLILFLGDSLVLIKKIKHASLLTNPSVITHIMTLFSLVLQMSFFSSEPTLFLGLSTSGPSVCPSCFFCPLLHVSYSFIDFLPLESFLLGHIYLSSLKKTFLDSISTLRYCYSFLLPSQPSLHLILLQCLTCDVSCTPAPPGRLLKGHSPMISLLTNPKDVFVTNDIVELLKYF